MIREPAPHVSPESPPSPSSVDELLARARSLAGRTLGDLAREAQLSLPVEARRAKGFAGRLVERALGASAGTEAHADFPALGVELKTIPVDARGRSKESTFVTRLDPDDPDERRWESSRVREKLARVLWVPTEGEPAIALARRRVGWPVLWRPTPAQLAALREDFEALIELCDHGLLERVGARAGKILQLRPKAANARALQWSRDPEGAPIRAAPKAFYLRAGFTRELLADAWILEQR